jgi:thiamine-monophosphate kinase
MKLGLGPGQEFDAIRRLADRLGSSARGLGDDCAKVPWQGETLVLSTDLSIEGIHFERDWLTPSEIGWRSAAGALSDLAAAGAEPVGILVSLGVPDGERGAIEDIMAGAAEVTTQVGATVLGGDLTKAPVVTINVCVIGKSESGLGRGGAMPGDGLWLSDCVGGARAALESWLAGDAPTEDVRARFSHPIPRISTGQWLASHGAHAMIDLSDGLAGDAAHLAARSEVEVIIQLDQVPLGPGVAEAAVRAGSPPSLFGAAGGEDYELLAALPATFGSDDAKACREATGVELTAIGHVERGDGVQLLLDGQPQIVVGFDHFGR